MTAYKPKRRDARNAHDDLEFEDDSVSDNEADHAAMEALTVHLGNERYFDGYAE